MPRKKIFLVWDGREKDVIQVVGDFKKRGYDTVYWMGGGKEGVKISGAIFHDADGRRIRRDVTAKGVRLLDFPPPSAKILRQLYKQESLTLSMMNRRVGNITLDEKKRIYYHLIRYWEGVLELLKPDFIVATSHPHNISTFTLYACAKRRGILTPFTFETWLSDRIVVLRDYEEGSPRLRNAVTKALLEKAPVENLPEDLLKYYKEQTDKSVVTTPFDLKVFEKQFGGFNLLKIRVRTFWKSIFDLSLAGKLVALFRRTFYGNLRKEYEGVARKPDLSANYIYIPLHLQPEGSTSPLGDMFVDQILLIETVSHALPKGWKIYIKENPYQWSAGGSIEYNNVRYKPYYGRTAKLPGVQFVPIDMNPQPLIANAKAIATVGSRTALEALFRGIPALIFGYPWFMDAPGLIRVEDTESVREAISKIQAGFRPDRESAVAFLHGLGKASIRGFTDQHFIRLTSKVSPEESARRISELLADEMDEMTKESGTGNLK